jgi:hypothetical protein
MGPLLWYLEKDSAGNCVAKLSQSAATNLYTSRAELRYRQSQSSWGATLFYDTANSYFSPGEIARLNSQLAALSADAGDNCPSSAARVIGNDAIRFAPTTKKFWEDSISGSYQSVGVGYRLFLADMFSLNLDWGVPVYDPNGNDKECVSFSDPYASRGTATSAPTPPTCISRKPQYLREWDSVSNGLFNVFGFLKRTQISIEGKF